MEASLPDFTAQAFSAISPWTMVVALGAGLLTSIGPCNLAMLPILIAYISGGGVQSRRQGLALSVAFTLGSIITFVAMGVFVALFGGLFGLTQSVLYYVVAATCGLVGLHLLGILELPSRLFPQIQLDKPEAKGLPGALLLGLVAGLVGNQCGTPFLMLVLTLAFAQGKLLLGVVLLFAYGVGRGIPLIIAGTFAGALATLRGIAAHQRLINGVAGVVLLIAGAYFFWQA